MAFPLVYGDDNLSTIQFPFDDGSGVVTQKTVKIADKDLRDITIYYVNVTGPANCPDCFTWVEGGTETPCTLTVSSADAHAIYIIPTANLKGEREGSNNKYTEVFVCNGQWEKIGDASGVIDTETKVVMQESTTGTESFISGATYDPDTMTFNFKLRKYDNINVKVVK